MSVRVREMRLDETGLIIDYFHEATPEHLALIGVDRQRFPSRAQWQQFYAHDDTQPLARRRSLQLVWELEGETIGFSTADKIEFGREAYMHLHITVPALRRGGVGTACVRQSAALYFDLLGLARLYCEPHAFNVAPNRALQRAGFQYVMTHTTVPGPLNFEQAVTRWVLERSAVSPAAG